MCDHVITNNNNNHVCVLVFRRWSSGKHKSLRWAASVSLWCHTFTKCYSLHLIAHFLILFFRRWSQHDWHHWRWDGSSVRVETTIRLLWLEVCGKRRRWWWWWFCFLLQFCWPSLRLRRAQVSQAQISYYFYSFMCMFLTFSLFSCVVMFFHLVRTIVSGRPGGAVLLYSDCLIQSVSKTEISEIPCVKETLCEIIFDVFSLIESILCNNRSII